MYTDTFRYIDVTVYMCIDAYIHIQVHKICADTYMCAQMRIVQFR